MANQIRAIETHYKGYRFRSRLEARWAVFFDAVGLRWRYETEGFVCGEGPCYLPDFYLPDADLYVEVKPDLPRFVTCDDHPGLQVGVVMDGREWTPFGKFMVASLHLSQRDGNQFVPRLYMLCGVPGVPVLERYKGNWKLNDGSVAVHFPGPVAEGACLLPVGAWSDQGADDGVDLWPYYLRPGTLAGSHDVAYLPASVCTHFYVGAGRDFASQRLVSAYAAARSARFEHGETPRP
jgi:hypothetical protein